MQLQCVSTRGEYILLPLSFDNLIVIMLSHLIQLLPSLQGAVIAEVPLLFVDLKRIKKSDAIVGHPPRRWPTMKMVTMLFRIMMMIWILDCGGGASVIG